MAPWIRIIRMENVIRSVSDMTSADRLVIENFLGTHLTEDQKVSIRVLDAGSRPLEKADAGSKGQQLSPLPEWCNVYHGLSDAQVAEIESSIVRSHDSRDL